jgi:pyridoxine 5-phosphate synthase
LQQAAAMTADLGLECHAGHGLTYANVTPVAVIPEVMELNIGHFLIGAAITQGLAGSVRQMSELMRAARSDGRNVIT